MTILPIIRAVAQRQQYEDALTRLVTDAQREARTLLGQIDVSSVLRAQAELEALAEPMARAREQVEMAFGGSARLTADQLAPTSAALEAMKELHQPHITVLESMKELSEPTSRVLEAMKELHQPHIAAAEQLAREQQEMFDAVTNAVKAVEEPVRRLHEQMAAITAPLIRVDDLVKQLDPTQYLSAQQLAEMVRWSYIDRRVARLLATRGWLGVERHLDDELMGLLKIRGRNKGAAVDRAICAAFRRNRHARLNAMVKRWQKIPYLRDRGRIIRDAVAAHRERRYTLSIAALLPMVDGLAAEIKKAHPHLVRAKGKKGGKPNLGEVVADIVKVYDTNGRPRDYADAVIAAVSQRVFAEYHFATDPVPSTLNRHGILHGRIPGYASAVNSLRSFLLVDVMAYIAESLP